MPQPRHPGADPEVAQAFKGELGAQLEAHGIPTGSRVWVWVMDEARFGLQTETRKFWITVGVRPSVLRQIRYEQGYLCGAFWMWWRAERSFYTGFHVRPGDSRLPEGVHILPLPPYSPELNPCEQIQNVIRDSVGFANGLFKSINKMRQHCFPVLDASGRTRWS